MHYWRKWDNGVCFFLHQEERADETLYTMVVLNIFVLPNLEMMTQWYSIMMPTFYMQEM
jgi:hypothetical protein